MGARHAGQQDARLAIWWRDPASLSCPPARRARLEHLEATGADLYVDQQKIDTTNPMGKLVFQVTGAFAEFERSMIRQRVRAGLKTSRRRSRATTSFTSMAGVLRRRLGRPSADPDKLRKARAELAKGIGINRVAKAVGLGVGTVQKLKNEMVEARTKGRSSPAARSSSVDGRRRIRRHAGA